MAGESPSDKGHLTGRYPNHAALGLDLIRAYHESEPIGASSQPLVEGDETASHKFG